MLQAREGLKERGLNVSGVNPLGSFHVTRDDAPMQVDPQSLEVAFEVGAGQDRAIGKGGGRGESHQETRCLTTERLPPL